MTSKEVVAEYTALATKLNQINATLTEMNTVDVVQLIDKIRIVERKMGLVYTLFKASVYSVTQQDQEQQAQLAQEHLDQQREQLAQEQREKDELDRAYIQNLQRQQYQQQSQSPEDNQQQQQQQQYQQRSQYRSSIFQPSRSQYGQNQQFRTSSGHNNSNTPISASRRFGSSAALSTNRPRLL